jgi:hypothetical protein
VEEGEALLHAESEAPGEEEAVGEFFGVPVPSAAVELTVREPMEEAEGRLFEGE